MSDTAEFKRNFMTTDRLLQTVGGLLLLVTSGISWRLYDRVDNHEGRLIRVEERAENAATSAKEMKDDIRIIKDELKSIAVAVGAKKP